MSSTVYAGPARHAQVDRQRRTHQSRFPVLPALVDSGSFGGRWLSDGGVRMALYAFDGTGQKDDHPELENDGDTNVARFYFAYRPSDVQLPIDDRFNHYQRGIGSEGLFRKALGGITGFGGKTFVRRALDK